MRDGEQAIRARVAFGVLLGALVLAAPGTAGAIDAPSPGVDPPLANDFSCQPTAEHPYPVVLVHGTAADMTISWNLISPALAGDGYCVFAFDYGGRGLGRIQDSTRTLADFVDRVLQATGVRKVALVGHSQGGMLARRYVRFGGGNGKVTEIVGLVPSNHGTTTPLAPLVDDLAGCPACRQQVAGSRILEKLNRGDETPGRIDYTQVTTKNDEIVTPYSSAFLDGPARHVTNVLLQDKCPLDVFEHIGIIYDPNALGWIQNALGRPGPADPGFKPPLCV